MACERGRLDIVDILLKAGADVEALRLCVLQTPLMRAAEFGHVAVVERLLEAGADIDKQTDECSSALIIACHFGQVDVFRCLLGMPKDNFVSNKVPVGTYVKSILHPSPH